MRRRITSQPPIRAEIKSRYQNRVRECRLRGLIISEAELSRRTGIERTTLSALENNRRFLCIEHALLIKEVLGCSLDDLYVRTPLPEIEKELIVGPQSQV